MANSFLCTYQFDQLSTDRKRALITLSVTSGVLLLHEIFHISWFSTRHYFFPLYVLFVCHFIHYWSFIVIMTTNPGLIQKIEYEYQKSLELLQIPKNEHSRSHIQISNVINIQSKTSKIKLCHTCNIYRPPRTHHCSQCGVCIERLDHHCPWLGVCIGKMNYKYFYLYLVTLIALIVNVVAMCLTILVEGDIVQALPILLILVCVPAFIFAGIMLVFHSYLLAVNLTTREYIDGFWGQVAGNPDKKDNPFKNILKVLFSKSQRQIKFKYTQFQIKGEGQSSSEQRMSSKQGSNKKGSKGSRGSSSDEHNNSQNVFKGQKIAGVVQRQKQKQNSFQRQNIQANKLKVGKYKNGNPELTPIPTITSGNNHNDFNINLLLSGANRKNQQQQRSAQPPFKQKSNNPTSNKQSNRKKEAMIQDIALKVDQEQFQSSSLGLKGQNIHQRQKQRKSSLKPGSMFEINVNGAVIDADANKKPSKESHKQQYEEEQG